MNYTILGEQIQTFRKAAGLTQKELGRSIGVSTQAVSQWECGGTPDVTLLPAIADRLGVTIDALFGRESGQLRDMSETFIQWLRTVPEKERIARLSRLIWETALYGVADDMVKAPKIAYPETCEMEGEAFGQGKVLMRSVVATRGGYAVGVGAEDMSFMAVFPEPEAGYERYLADNEEYRKLFGALAMPGALEVLRYFCRDRFSHYIPAVVAKRTGLAPEATESVLEALFSAHLLQKREVTLEEGTVPIYAMLDDSGIVPLLYFARFIGQTAGTALVNLQGRSELCFHREEGGHGET